ncbi:MAG: DUF1993 domain-containing protein [Sulfuricaulis sp.]|uniref:DUF1993 domain-containing protein n=1 Tax=Sulfuricaulis sp. TaxID=2003553 RepID=UPI0025F59F01|nr:DUF1993 domain-containing protein [Sulfuricaulis sp.]MCR4346894.1 DUF1993 domain-containing protein [Sulfuricaulis sp.]
MTLSMYQASIPVFIHMHGNLAGILDKGATHAEANKIDPSVLVNARLYPNMFALARQVQIATDATKGCAARLSGQTPPSYEDNEASFAELKARLDKTVAFLRTFKPEQIDGSEDKTIELKVGGKPMSFKGQAYLLHYVLPNLYFHTTTAYAILRHNGVPVGKADFLGKI